MPCWDLVRRTSSRRRGLIRPFLSVTASQCPCETGASFPRGVCQRNRVKARNREKAARQGSSSQRRTLPLCPAIGTLRRDLMPGIERASSLDPVTGTSSLGPCQSVVKGPPCFRDCIHRVTGRISRAVVTGTPSRTSFTGRRTTSGPEVKGTLSRGCCGKRLVTGDRQRDPGQRERCHSCLDSATLARKSLDKDLCKRAVPSTVSRGTRVKGTSSRRLGRPCHGNVPRGPCHGALSRGPGHRDLVAGTLP
mmetsp:Transcript_32623/g.114752  ORF Transcript_32623/g.114752 Transcript_32623/m.114752 type:complete len:250 (-) Transcript_32623:231-980(-)